MQTIGERLEDARKKKGISLREAAEATKIRGDYLQRFESNQFEFDLAEIYVRGFLRTYANYLKLPADKILNDYASLGVGSARPRQPNREVYGRMDISVASAAPVNEASAAAAPDASTQETPRRLSRPGNVSSGPALDPALVYKSAIILVGVIALALVIWGVVALVRSSSSGPSAPTGATSSITPASEPSITFVALDTVRLKVSVKNPDGTPGDVLLPDTTLVRGESRTVPKRGPLYLTASALENVAIEENGKRVNIRDQGLSGYNRVQIGR